jgi:hypothetical protein
LKIFREPRNSNIFRTLLAANQIQSTNNRHCFDRFNQSITFERPVYKSSKYSNVIVNQYQHSRSAFTNVFFPIPFSVQQHFNSNIISTTMLDMGRGARTTSIKTLPTLVPHVMCFNCKEAQSKPTSQDKDNDEINIILDENKSLMLIQLKKPMLFSQIIDQKKCKKFRKDYNFYDNSQIVDRQKNLKKEIII